jgi:hypothetical protein
VDQRMEGLSLAMPAAMGRRKDEKPNDDEMIYV